MDQVFEKRMYWYYVTWVNIIDKFPNEKRRIGDIFGTTIPLEQESFNITDDNKRIVVEQKQRYIGMTRKGTPHKEVLDASKKLKEKVVKAWKFKHGISY